MPSNPTTISTFTNIPSRADPVTFEAKTDSFLTQLNTFVTQTNSSITSTETNIEELYTLHIKSNSSMVIDYGLKTFTSVHVGFFDPFFVKLIPVENPNSFMSGIIQQVTGPVNGVYTCNFLATELSGQGEGYSDWLAVPCSQPQPWGSNTAPAPTTPAPYGSWWFDENYFYFCIEDNTWRRTPLSSW